MPRLRILAGPSLTDLTPINPNSDEPIHIKSDGFEGQVAVYIKGFEGSGRTQSPYFDHEKRKGITWSIQLQGAFAFVVLAFDPDPCFRPFPRHPLRGRYPVWQHL